MKVWLLVSSQKEHRAKFGIDRFIKEAKELGITLHLIVPSQVEIIEPNLENKVYYQNRKIDAPDAVIPRVAGNTHFSLAVIRGLEKMGCFVLNSSDAIERTRDKLHAFQHLTQHNIPVPKTILAKQQVNTKLVERELGFPVVLKKITGSYGDGITLCDSAQELEDMMGMVQNGGQIPPLIIQEFISSKIGEDIRIIVIGGRAIGAMLRKGKEGSFKSNFSAGGSVELFELTPELEWLATESAKALGLNLAGVDILFDKDGYKICEVNSNPGFLGFEPATGINVAQEILKFVQLKTEGTIPAMH